MKLSIITINYNNAEGLRKTLASVASQTYPNIEHIIVDGASTDGSVEVIREYVNASPQPSPEGKGRHIIWSSEPDTGIYNAMNKGIEIALGRRVVNSLNRSELLEDKNKGCEMDINAFNRSELAASTPYTLHSTPSQPCEHYVQILNSGDLLAAPDVTERMMAALIEASPKSSPIGKDLHDADNSSLLADGGLPRLGNPNGRNSGERRSNQTAGVGFFPLFSTAICSNLTMAKLSSIAIHVAVRCIRQSLSSISIKARSIMTARISVVTFLKNTDSITSRCVFVLIGNGMCVR